MKAVRAAQWHHRQIAIILFVEERNVPRNRALDHLVRVIAFYVIEDTFLNLLVINTIFQHICAPVIIAEEVRIRKIQLSAMVAGKDKMPLGVVQIMSSLEAFGLADIDSNLVLEIESPRVFRSCDIHTDEVSKGELKRSSGVNALLGKDLARALIVFARNTIVQ